VQAYLGHKNIQHTVRYTELATDRFKDFRKRKISGRSKNTSTLGTSSDDQGDAACICGGAGSRNSEPPNERRTGIARKGGEQKLDIGHGVRSMSG
jgi:hypothetical protein